MEETINGYPPLLKWRILAAPGTFEGILGRAEGQRITTMKHKKMWAVLLAAAVVLVAGGVFMFTSVTMKNTSPADTVSGAEETAQSTVTITDEELSRLISGELTLDSLVQNAGEVQFEQEEASSEQPQDAAQSEAAESAPESQQENQKEQAAPPQKEAAASSAPAAESSQLSGYEAELKVLIQRVYAVKARAEKGLDSCIASAKEEYWALPQKQQTQTRKVMIVVSKAGELRALQASCDKEMDEIVSQMRKLLQENGQSTALADEVMQAYNAEKSSRYTELKNKLYS